MNDTVISVEHLTKCYKLYEKPSDRLRETLGRKVKVQEHYALKDVNFQIRRGECVGVIGTNGSGKSTMLKIITGVVNPTEGQVRVNGRISALLELGAGFNMEYSGLENIYLNGAMIGFSKEEIDRKLDDILQFADIGEFVHQPVKTYSSGMFVRLAFAVAINIDPEILIVDEALSVGDVFFQAKCYRKFEEFKAQGKTIIFVSHDLGSISRYCDRVVLLNQGVLLDQGTPRDMINLYKKVLVHMAGEQGVDDQLETADPSEKKVFSRPFPRNPNVLEYGGERAEILDFTIEDAQGLETNTIEKMTEFTIRYLVRFYEPVDAPIFTFTIKDLKGTAITGTNTMYERVTVPPQKPGEERQIAFTQKMNLQGGNYLLSISCTGYENGEFQVYHRLYDVCSISVVSSKNTVGFFDMDSQVSIN